MEKVNYLTLSPYLRNGCFVITHNTGEMYMYIEDRFIRKTDGLTYTYDEIPPIYIITCMNMYFIAMGINRWNKDWCARNIRYKRGELYVNPPF